MMDSPPQKPPPESLSKRIAEGAGDDAVQELTPKEKALQGMSYVVLGGAFLLLLSFGGLYIFSESHFGKLQNDFVTMCITSIEDPDVKLFCDKYSSEERDSRESAKEVFEFMKSFIPPIVTLVLGAHYVTKNNTD